MRARLDRVMVVVMALVFADTFGYAVVLPLLPFAARRDGAPEILIGAVFATYSLCQLAATPALGALSDRLGRRPVLIMSQLGSAAGFVVMVVSGALIPLFISRVVDGLTAGNIGTANAVVLDRYPRAEWAGRFAMLGSATGLGIIGGLLTGFAVAPLGLRAGAAVAAGVALLTAAMTAALLPETRRRDTRAGEPGWLRRALRGGGPGSLRRTVVASLLSMTLQAGFLVALPLFLLRQLGYHERSSALFLIGLVAIAAVIQFGLLPRFMRAGVRRPALVAFAAAAIGGVLIAVGRGLPVIAAGAALVMAGVVTLNPAFSALVGARREAGDEGALMGVNQATASAGQLIGPLAAYATLGVAAAGLGVLVVILAAAGAAVLARVEDATP